MQKRDRNILRDLLLERLSQSALETVAHLDWSELLKGLPSHSSEWDGPIIDSTIARWRNTHPSGPFLPPLTAKARRRVTRARKRGISARRREVHRAHLEALADRFAAGIPGAVTADGVILVEAVREVLPLPKPDGSTLRIVLDDIRGVLTRKGYAKWDETARALVTPEEHSRRAERRAAEQRAAAERFRQWCTAAASLSKR